MTGALSMHRYPVRFGVEPQISHNRLTCFFRVLLAIPYAIVTVAIGYVAGLVAFLAWFAILFTGRFPRGMWNFSAMYMMWRSRYYSYTVMLRDEYPPFGNGSYPAYIDIDYVERRSRLSVFFRALLAIPQLVVTWFIAFAWLAGFVIAWFAILITGRYPEGVRRFMVGALRWLLRLEAYLLLLVDRYPPFSLGLDEPSILPSRPPAPEPLPDDLEVTLMMPRLDSTEPEARPWRRNSPATAPPASIEHPGQTASSDEPAFHDFPSRPSGGRDG